MKAADLICDIALDTVTGRTSDGDGGYTDVYTDLDPDTDCASIARLTQAGAERVVGNAIEAKVTHLITLRFRDDITTKTRITFDDRIFLVRDVVNVNEADETLQIAAEEIIS